MVDLFYALSLPPEQAIAYFRQKGFAFSWDWYEVWQQAYAKAFTVAKVLRQDILDDIRGAVDAAIAEGQTLTEFSRKLEPTLKSKGWWGKVMLGDGAGGAEIVQLGSPWRLQTIYRTNLQTAFMAGRWQEMIENVDDRPYFMYVAVLDARTRPAHRSLHGIIARYDSPFWASFWPPNGWGCRCRARALTHQQATAMVKDGRGVWVAEENLGTAEALVSKTTGELAEVATYRAGALTVSPDVGWSYNPGAEAFPPGSRWRS